MRLCMDTKEILMKYLVTPFIVAACFAFSQAYAGVPEVLAAEAAVMAAKERAKELKKGLSKVEKAELAVALATAKLVKAQAAD